MRRPLLVLPAFLLVAFAAPTVAQDAVKVDSKHYKVEFENDQVRVLDFTLRKGDSERAHFHPANVAVFLADFKIRFILPDGSTRMRVGRTGEVAWSDAIVHTPENIGDTDAHGILIELKAAPATAFVDGDRGGELILKELFQTCEVDFVARAPNTDCAACRTMRTATSTPAATMRSGICSRFLA